MKEIDPKYNELLKQTYPDLVVDYVLLENADEYKAEQSHKEAVKHALNILSKRKNRDYRFDESKMTGEAVDPEYFFFAPADAFAVIEDGKVFINAPEKLTYAFAFLQPPHGQCYSVGDFYKVNFLLFPNRDLDIISWDGDFTDYFDEGKEWWGYGLWSIHDKLTGRFAVIGASATN
ncbi:MAG: hypothetical protein IIZ52_01625 [Erysipelotrichaceae bacterium]|nr:hypothetical protein [Erysipelotrichaceae bacterium]MBQ1512176.1 hypothetical protein [Erysipelotrichaceae bacterium]